MDVLKRCDSFHSCSFDGILVIINIIINAIEAMQDRRGVLQISTSMEEDTLLIMIADRGKGINKSDEELIFEPFFSTKRDVEGTGLGLPIAHGTIMNLGGEILFTSEEGKGSVFTIRLPLANQGLRAVHQEAV